MIDSLLRRVGRVGSLLRAARTELVRMDVEYTAVVERAEKAEAIVSAVTARMKAAEDKLYRIQQLIESPGRFFPPPLSGPYAQLFRSLKAELTKKEADQ